ncbi:hypothetical protein [Phenylobacterium sp.]|uniref:hypothetical protein n=1 Tax=Phenylobacterium sp. TaxID=1871053 RepID=UPI0035AD78BA
MLEELADLGMDLTRRLHGLAVEAETPEAAERLALSFHRLSRSVRQTLALEARFERDALRAERWEADVRREQVRARKAYVGDVASRLIWTEAERDDVGTLLVTLKRWIDEEAFFEDAFLDPPVEDILRQLLQDLGLAANDLEDEPCEAQAPAPAPSTASRSPSPDGGGEFTPQAASISSPASVGEGDREAVEGAQPPYRNSA